MKIIFSSISLWGIIGLTLFPSMVYAQDMPLILSSKTTPTETGIRFEFLLSSYIIAKEYGELITYKLSLRNPNLISNIKNGLICNVLFCMPVLNVVAPVLTTIIITNNYIKDKSL